MIEIQERNIHEIIESLKGLPVSESTKDYVLFIRQRFLDRDKLRNLLDLSHPKSSEQWDYIARVCNILQKLDSYYMQTLSREELEHQEFLDYIYGKEVEEL